MENRMPSQSMATGMLPLYQFTQSSWLPSTATDRVQTKSCSYHFAERNDRPDLPQPAAVKSWRMRAPATSGGESEKDCVGRVLSPGGNFGNCLPVATSFCFTPRR